MFTHKPTKAESPLLTEVEAADALRLSTRTLQAWRIKKVGPQFIRAGRAVRYRETDLADWIEASVIRPSGATKSRGSEPDGEAASTIDDSKNRHASCDQENRIVAELERQCPDRLG